MANKSWTVQLNGRSHTVDLQHGTMSGERTIRLDGTVVHRSRQLVDTGSDHAFEIDGHPAVVRISTNGVTFNYELGIDPPQPVALASPLRSGSASTAPLTGTARRDDSAESASLGRMHRDIRSWAWWLLGGGAVSIVAGQAGAVSPTWGVAMMITGSGALVFHEPANFVVFGTILAWAGISNLLGMEPVWGVVGVIQIVGSVQTFRAFFRYRRATEGREASVEPVSGNRLIPILRSRPNRLFPLLALAMTLVAVVALVAFVVSINVGPDSTGDDDLPGVAGMLAGLVEGFAALGLGLGLASVLSGYQYSDLAKVAVVVDGLLLFALVVVTFI